MKNRNDKENSIKITVNCVQSIKNQMSWIGGGTTT